MEKVQHFIGYSRVSTDGQRDGQGYGIKIQEDRIKQYSDEKGLPFVRIFRDEGVSGALAVRPAMVELMSYAEANKHLSLGLVFLRLDRLARDLLIQEGLIADFHKHGLQVFSIEEEDLCSTDPTRKLFRQMKGMLAEYEKAMVTARMSAGRLKKVESGGGYAGGRVAYGFCAKGDEYVPVADELEVVKKILKLRRKVKLGKRTSYDGIAKQLNADGIPAPSGKRWHSRTVQYIASNDFYKGFQHYGSVCVLNPAINIHGVN